MVSRPNEPPVADPDRPLRHWERNDSHRIIYTTHRCPHRCIFCLDADFPDCPEPSADDVRRRLDEAAADGFPGVTFMAREPLARPDIVSLIRHGADLGLAMCVSTNALRFADEDFLARCIEAGLDGVEMSFHYPDAETYAAITRAPARMFDRLLRALDNLDRNAVAHPERTLGVHVNTVVSGYNVHRLHEVVGHLDERLRHAPAGVSLKAMIVPRGRDGVLAEAHAIVPFPALREHLGRFFAERPEKPIAVRLGTLPYCAVPGGEHLSSYLSFIWRQLRVEWNLAGRDEMVDVIAHQHDHSLPQDPILLDTCSRCTLDPICGYRSIFPDLATHPEQGPVPSDRDPIELMIASGATRDQAEVALEGARRAMATRPKVARAPVPDEGAAGPPTGDPPAGAAAPADEAVLRVARRAEAVFAGGLALAGGYRVSRVRVCEKEVEVDLRREPPDGAPGTDSAAGTDDDALRLLLEPARRPDQRCFARVGDVCVSYSGSSIGRDSPKMAAVRAAVVLLTDA